MKKFTEYKSLDLAGIADEVLARWTKDDTFHKSITTREGHPTFVFYEGPPSANGTPGIHHVMARTIKDVFCRFKTQQGYLVHRKNTIANLTTISTERVKAIIAMNRAGEKPESLIGENVEPTTTEPTYHSSEDSIDRFDNKGRKSKRNKRNKGGKHPQNDGVDAQQEQSTEQSMEVAEQPKEKKEQREPKERRERSERKYRGGRPERKERTEGGELNQEIVNEQTERTERTDRPERRERRGRNFRGRRPRSEQGGNNNGNEER